MSCNNPSGRGCINPIACSHDGFCEFPSPRLTEAIAKTCKRIEEAGAGSTKVAAKLKSDPADPAAVEAWREAYAAVYGCEITHPAYMYANAYPILQSYGDQREADARADERARVIEWLLSGTGNFAACGFGDDVAEAISRLDHLKGSGE